MTHPTVRVWQSFFLEVPTYARDGDAAVDLKTRQGWVLDPGKTWLAPTGLHVAIPEGFVGLVTPRSGLAVRHGLSIVNSPGVIDSGYRGEIQCALINLGQDTIYIKLGDRIAQMLIMPVSTASFCVVEELDELGDTERGVGGFGSTGVG